VPLNDAFLLDHVSAVAEGELVEIQLAHVEFGAVVAGEHRCAAGRDAATAARAGAVGHDGI